MSAVPADPDTLSFFPGTDTGSHLVDDAGDFMAGYPGKRNSGKEAFFDKRIAFEKGRIPPMQFLMRTGHFFYLAF